MPFSTRKSRASSARRAGIFSAILASRSPSNPSRAIPKMRRKSASEILFHICIERGPTAP